MKEFDLEKLKRENIYRTPDRHFEEMQSRVLSALPQEKSRRIGLRWLYGAAAAVAVVAGITFNVNTGQAEQQNNVTASTVQDIPATYSLVTPKTAQQSVNIEDDLSEDLTPVKKSSPTVTVTRTVQTPAGIVSSGTPDDSEKEPQTELQMDHILAGFTSAELADVSRNAEQDVYLDLYN